MGFGFRVFRAWDSFEAQVCRLKAFPPSTPGLRLHGFGLQQLI